MNYQQVEKIKKLFRLARNNENEHERELAIAKALELMAKHRIELKDDEQDVQDFCTQVVQFAYELPFKRISKEKALVMIIILEVYRLEHLFTMGSKNSKLTLIGELMDCEAAFPAIDYAWWHSAECFKDYFNKNCKEALKRKRKKIAYRNRVREDFFLGYVAGLEERLKAISNKYAVVLHRSDALIQRQQEIMEEHSWKKKRCKLKQGKDVAARYSGYKSGLEAPGRTGVIGGAYGQ